jgi:hypothetical protein
MVTLLAYLFAAGRVVLGLAPILAARRASALLGFPPEHDNPTTRLMARLFGVRDIGLGVLVVGALHGHASLSFAFLFNAAHDLGDAIMIAVPLARRQGIDRAAALSLGFAVLGGASWVLVFLLHR